MFLFLLAALPTTALASQASQPHCFETTIPIHVSTEVPTFNLAPFANSYESNNFLVKSVTRTADAKLLLGNTTTLDKTFDINVQYCEPQGPKNNGAVQLLTHGIGFDKSYWNLGDASYNYILSATAAGYSTLSYDRLGVGHSEIADPYLEVQAGTELAILTQLTSLLRSGSLCRRIPTPDKVIHVGHSYGSLLANALAAADPTLSDGLVLTGYSHRGDWNNLFQLCLGFHLARENNPLKWAAYPSGYLTWGDKYDAQCAFFSYPFFDPRVLELAEATKQPLAIAELLSFTSLDLAAHGFTGPVLMISGQQDMPFCGGDCTGLLDGPGSPSPAMFPKSAAFQAYLQPNTGHGMNSHFNASAGYDVITSFLKTNGL